MRGPSEFDRWYRFLTMPLAAAVLVACGGSGGGGNDDDDEQAGSRDVVFSGGSLEDLRALNAALTFGRLEIDGPLRLPIAGSASLTVEELVVTTLGSIGYNYSTCEYRDAPSLAIKAEGDVTLLGDILLGGRSGTSVTSGASCNSCYGQDGGDLSVDSGGDLQVAARIDNHGGFGASFRSVGFPSSPCSAGGSGNLALVAAGDVDFDEAEIDNNAGSNFDNQYGASGDAEISAGGNFTMQGGGFDTTGALDFSANMAVIHGPIDFGSLNDSIGGASDNVPPVLLLLEPAAGAVLQYNRPFDIRIQAYDNGMGLRDVRVEGFDIDQRYVESDFIGGELTIAIDAAGDDADLDIVATDNAGLQTTLGSLGLSTAYLAEIEPNQVESDAQTLISGDILDGDILTDEDGVAYQSVQDTLQGLGDPDFATRLIEDSYLLPIAAGETFLSVSLNFSGNSGSPDIDIYLVDSTGAVVESSTRPAGTTVESIFLGGVSASETYHLLLQAFDVSQRANYRLTRN